MPREIDPSTAPSSGASGADRKRAQRRARWLVTRELLRALGQALLLPARAIGQLCTAARWRALLADDLATTPHPAPDRRELRLPPRPLRIFISCAEPSGEIHAVNLVRSLREALREAGAPEPRFVGLGGERLAGEGVELVGNPVASARMGFSGVLGALPVYLRLLTDAATELVLGQDLCIGVDSPALHVPLAHMARAAGATTVQHITPQYWGWAPWRVHGFRKAVDLALTILPFEPAWFERQRVRVEHVGHPLLDEPSVAEARPTVPEPEPPRLALLPGSRSSVIDRNLPVMLEALSEPLERHRDWQVRVLQSGSKHDERICAHLERSELDPQRVQLSHELEPELARSTAAFSVSGTILVHLLRRGLPAVVQYRLEGALQEALARRLLLVPHFSSVNLLAGQAVYPEFSFPGEAPPADLREALEQLLGSQEHRAAQREQLELASARLGPPGASHRAALAALSLLSSTAAP